MFTKSSLRDYVGIMTGISGNTQYNTPQNKISMHWKKNESYFQLYYHDIMMQRKLKAINTISLLLTIVSSLIAWPITTFFTPDKGTVILISISAFIVLYQGRQVPQLIVVKLDPVMLFTCGFTQNSKESQERVKCYTAAIQCQWPLNVNPLITNST